MPIGALLALAGAVFFTTVEIAFASAAKLHIDVQGEQGIYSGRILSRFVKDPSALIGTTLVGKVLATAAYVALALQPAYAWLAAALPAAGWLRLPLVALVLFTVYFLCVECLTKFVFLVNATAWLRVVLVPLRVLHVALYPFVAGMAVASRWVVRHVLRIPDAEAPRLFSLTDLNGYLEQVGLPAGGREESAVDTRIFNNALSFKNVRVRECMVPRTELSAVAVTDPVESLRAVFVESGHSKVLVYKDTLDNVLGYCHALDMFRKPKEIQQVLVPIKVVAEATPATDLFIAFTKEQKSVALVVDEYGGTSGLVSLEDLVEHLFGEIQDEHDSSEDWVEEKLDEHTYLLSGRHAIAYLNDKYRLQLPPGDYDTLGGLLISAYGDLPAANEQIAVPPFVFTVLAVQETRIDVVKMRITT